MIFRWAGFQPSRYTRNGAIDHTLEILPGRPFPNPLGDVLGSINLAWQLDIWRQLRNARDAAEQRFLAASERRNYFVTKLVAEVGENYYRPMALDKRNETLDQIIALQEKSHKIARTSSTPVAAPSLPAFPGGSQKEPEREVNRQSRYHRSRESHQLPSQSLSTTGRASLGGISGSADQLTKRWRAVATFAESPRHPPG